jgi:hypothetical protein
MRVQEKVRSFLFLRRRGGAVQVQTENGFSYLNNTTPALRATPPQLRRDNCFIPKTEFACNLRSGITSPSRQFRDKSHSRCDLE